MLITDLSTIALAETEKEEENFHFKNFLETQDEFSLDTSVQQLNDIIAPQVDCTLCGNCCNTLMINVTQEEAERLALHLGLSEEETKEKYIETSLQGNMIMNTIPCGFLCDKKCTIYEQRFNECREFPQLDRNGFKGRLFSTFMHYGRCLIIHNVIEQLKIDLKFKPEV